MKNKKLNIYFKKIYFVKLFCFIFYKIKYLCALYMHKLIQINKYKKTFSKFGNVHFELLKLQCLTLIKSRKILFLMI